MIDLVALRAAAIAVIEARKTDVPSTTRDSSSGGRALLAMTGFQRLATPEAIVELINAAPR